MKFTVSREAILKPLQLLAGVVERRQTMPILANVLIALDNNMLSMTGSDLEVEIVGRIPVVGESESGEITVPAKKLLDICRTLPDSSELQFLIQDQKAILKCGRSRFSLSTLDASDFPNVEAGSNEVSIRCKQKEIKRLIDRTSFAMAQQDVRYYLNGMLWELRPDSLRAVTTDGHRLAMCDRSVSVDVSEVIQAILPRKGVVELSRLMTDSESEVELVLGLNHLRAITNDFIFTSKLVEGKFPDYERVLPNSDQNVLVGDRIELKQAFARTAILANDKFRGVRLALTNDKLTVTANNPEQEEAEDTVSVDYNGEELELGFNVSYLQDATNVMDTEKVRIFLSDTQSTSLVEETDTPDSTYIIMPMRL